MPDHVSDHDSAPNPPTDPADSAAADPQRGARLSQHAYPVPLLRRLTAVVVALGLAGVVVGILGLVIAGLGYGLPLLVVMAPFMATLALPLVQLAVMHPAITVYERGLWLEPLLWRGSWVAWDAVREVTDHTLIRRILTKRGDLERDGRLIVVEGVLPGVYRVIGGLAGLGWRTRAFGIATHAHADYKTLLNAIQRYKQRR